MAWIAAAVDRRREEKLHRLGYRVVRVEAAHVLGQVEGLHGTAERRIALSRRGSTAGAFSWLVVRNASKRSPQKIEGGVVAPGLNADIAS